MLRFRRGPRRGRAGRRAEHADDLDERALDGMEVLARRHPDDLIEKSFPYTFHFFWGAGEVVKNFLAMWNSVKTNKQVGTFYSDTPTGRAFWQREDRTAERDVTARLQGSPGRLLQDGHRRLHEPGDRLQERRRRNRLRPRAAEPLGDLLESGGPGRLQAAGLHGGGRVPVRERRHVPGPRGDGMSTEVWWTPKFPYKSSITGQTARELATDWENSTGKQWTQPIGYAHAIWEVALAALGSAADPKDKESVKQAIANLSVDTVVGPVRFKDTPIKNVAVTSMAGGQWRKTKNGRFPFELLIVYNATAPQIPVEAELKLLSQLG